MTESHSIGEAGKNSAATPFYWRGYARQTAPLTEIESMPGLACPLARLPMQPLGGYPNGQNTHR
jgi:hypothetical protein